MTCWPTTWSRQHWPYSVIAKNKRRTASRAESEVRRECAWPAQILHGDLQLSGNEWRRTLVELLAWQLDRRRVAGVVDNVRHVQFAKRGQRRRAVETDSVVSRNC